MFSFLKFVWFCSELIDKSRVCGGLGDGRGTAIFF